MNQLQRTVAAAGVVTILIGCGSGSSAGRASSESTPPSLDAKRLRNRARLDPAGRSIAVGNMPLGATASPDGKHVVLALSGWRLRATDILFRSAGASIQHIEQPGAFVGLAWSGDGRSLYVSGGAADVVYRYSWQPNADHPASLADSITLGHGASGVPGTRYPAGIATSADG